MVLNIGDKCIFPFRDTLFIGTIKDIENGNANYGILTEKIISENDLEDTHSAVWLYAPCIYTYKYSQHDFITFSILCKTLKFLHNTDVYHRIIVKEPNVLTNVLAMYLKYHVDNIRFDKSNQHQNEFYKKISDIYKDISLSIMNDYNNNINFYQGGFKDGVPF